MKLSELITAKSNRSKKKRLGRGIGSGKGGHTVGRGHKGQKARKGNSKPWTGFEGGQVPLYKRLPQLRGFRVFGKGSAVVVNLNVLNKVDTKDIVTPKTLLEEKIIKKLPKEGVKILSMGELKKKLSLKGFKYSEEAKKKIVESGSKIVK